MARPSKYESHVQPRLETIKAWCRRGLTNAEIAENLSISRDSLNEYRKKYPVFSDILKREKDESIIQIENALFKRAEGYNYIEVTKELRGKDEDRKLVITKEVTKEVAPNVTAQLAFLNNRASAYWYDRRNVNTGDDDDGNIDELFKAFKESAAKHGMG